MIQPVRYTFKEDLKPDWVCVAKASECLEAVYEC